MRREEVQIVQCRGHQQVLPCLRGDWRTEDDQHGRKHRGQTNDHRHRHQAIAVDLDQGVPQRVHERRGKDDGGDYGIHGDSVTGTHRKRSPNPAPSHAMDLRHRIDSRSADRSRDFHGSSRGHARDRLRPSCIRCGRYSSRTSAYPEGLAYAVMTRFVLLAGLHAAIADSDPWAALEIWPLAVASGVALMYPFGARGILAAEDSPPIPSQGPKPDILPGFITELVPGRSARVPEWFRHEANRRLGRRRR